MPDFPPKSAKKHKPETLLGHAGRRSREHHGIVNPPVYHASTILFPTLDALEQKEETLVSYGRHGTPTTFALQETITALEEGHGTLLAPSGQAATAIALLSLLGAGDHLLVSDSVYQPTRGLCDGLLRHFGITVDYYDPLIGADIAGLVTPQTKAVFMESPGSQTFEVQDVPAIAAAARNAGIRSIIDNTWSAGFFFKPLRHGVDVSIQAATKYLSGHADVMMGSITANEQTWDTLRHGYRAMGQCVGPDDVYLTLRGVRTLAVRLERHMKSGLEVAGWLQQRPEVIRVRHPAMAGDPGHEIWKRDFSGAPGLFSVELAPCSRKALAAMLDGMKLFAMGYSWGGYESLIIPAAPERSAVPWRGEGALLRLHVGLEDTGDLIADLEAGFARMAGG